MFFDKKEIWNEKREGKAFCGIFYDASPRHCALVNEEIKYKEKENLWIL